MSQTPDLPAKRLMSVNGTPEVFYKRMEQAESMLNNLSPFRDKLVHRVWFTLEDGPSVVNLLSGKTMQSAFTPEVITIADIHEKDLLLLKLTKRV